MFGRGVGRRVGPGCVRGDRAIVDDAPAARRLRFHDPECRLGAEERTGEVGVHHRLPLRQRQVLHRHGRRAGAGIVEQHIETAEFFHRSRKERFDRLCIRHIGGNRQHGPVGCKRSGLCERVRAAARERDGVAFSGKRYRDSATNTAARAGNQSNSLHVRCPLRDAGFCHKTSPEYSRQLVRRLGVGLLWWSYPLPQRRRRQTKCSAKPAFRSRLPSQHAASSR